MDDDYQILIEKFCEAEMEGMPCAECPVYDGCLIAFSG